MSDSSPKEKYTLAESATIFGIVGAAVLVVVPIITFPFVLLVAWMRETVWNWYCPLLHLPPVSLWLMVVISMFVGTFTSQFPTLKDDLLKYKSWQQSAFLIGGQVIVFLVIALIHIWFKA